MKIDKCHFTKRFDKHFVELPRSKQVKVKETLAGALENVHAPKLCLHEFEDIYAGAYSISAGGNLRIHFEMSTSEGKNTASQKSVGIHSQLYG